MILNGFRAKVFGLIYTPNSTRRKSTLQKQPSTLNPAVRAPPVDHDCDRLEFSERNWQENSC